MYSLASFFFGIEDISSHSYFNRSLPILLTIPWVLIFCLGPVPQLKGHKLNESDQKKSEGMQEVLGELAIPVQLTSFVPWGKPLKIRSS